PLFGGQALVFLSDQDLASYSTLMLRKTPTSLEKPKEENALARRMVETLGNFIPICPHQNSRPPLHSPPIARGFSLVDRASVSNHLESNQADNKHLGNLLV